MDEPKLTQRALSEIVENARCIYRDINKFDGVHTLDAAEILAKTYVLAYQSYLVKQGYTVTKKTNGGT